MKEQESFNYKRIAAAIEYIRENHRAQPDLVEIAKQIHLSPHHFQRLFIDWAGISPKKFLQYISIEYAKKILKNNSTLSDAAFSTGLSGTGRLHDLFINLEGMTPGEYKNGGLNLAINYNYFQSPFGEMLIASTEKGICRMTFAENKQRELEFLQLEFPNARFKNTTDSFQQKAQSLFTLNWNKPDKIKLHLKGTDFQLKVWQTLLKIPMGYLSSYRTISALTGNSKASRAIGSAIAKNPIAYIIPCHRVILSSGIIGEYRWGSLRKTALIGWEAAKSSQDILTSDF